MNDWSWGATWITCLLGIVSLFAVPEYIAVKNKQSGDTLSENIRLWLKTDTPGGGRNWLLLWMLFQTVLVWLLGHIMKWWA